MRTTRLLNGVLALALVLTVLVGVLSFADIVLADASNGLVSWWPANGNADDVWARNSGILMNGATFGTGMTRQAFQLDGVDDWVMVPTAPNLNFGTGDFTICLWVNFASTVNEQILVEKWIQTNEPAETKGWTLTKLNNNVIRFGGVAVPGEGSIINVAPPDIPVNVWFFVAVTRSGNAYMMYWNGELIGNATMLETLNFDSDASLKIGHRGNPDDTPGSTDWRGFYLNGLVDEVRLYNRALSPKEIAGLFNLQSSSPTEENTFTGSVRLPSQLPTDARTHFTDLGLGFITVLVFYFAATIFNSTVKENYETIQGWTEHASRQMGFIKAFFEKVIGGVGVLIGRKKRYYFEWLFVIAICAIIYVFLEPYFINLLRGVSLFLALFLGILIATLSYEGTQWLLNARRFGVIGTIKIFWVATIIAAICVVLSRIIHFHPGLIYGFVGAYIPLSIAKSERIDKESRRKAIILLVGTLVVLIVSLSAFFLRELVKNMVLDKGVFWHYLLDDFLVATFVIGLEGLLFSIALPFTFMDGKRLKDWNLWIWGMCTGMVAYVFYLVIINNEDHKLQDAVKNMNVIMMFGLMGVALTISGIIYLYFWLHNKRRHKAILAEQTLPIGKQDEKNDEPMSTEDAATNALSPSEEGDKQES